VELVLIGFMNAALGLRFFALVAIDFSRWLRSISADGW
jgi:hypothetical protein